MKAVLVFCEGRHDIVFTQRSLGTHGSCDWVDKVISDLPSPFGSNRVARRGIIAQRIAKHAVRDLSLREASHPPLPSFESIVENTTNGTMFFLIRTHGQDRIDVTLQLLEDLETTMTSVSNGTFAVSEYAVAFLFDANGEGVITTLASFCDRYGAHFGDLGNLEHAKWIAETTVPVGCFVFHRGTECQVGTIEDHLLPMVEGAWPERYAAAERFVDDNKNDTNKVSNNEAERLKATITVTGQFDNPGDPMSIIIGRESLPKKQFQRSELSADLACFLMATPWNNEDVSLDA